MKVGTPDCLPKHVEGLEYLATVQWLCMHQTDQHSSWTGRCVSSTALVLTECLEFDVVASLVSTAPEATRFRVQAAIPTPLREGVTITPLSSLLHPAVGYRSKTDTGSSDFQWLTTSISNMSARRALPRTSWLDPASHKGTGSSRQLHRHPVPAPLYLLYGRSLNTL